MAPPTFLGAIEFSLGVGTHSFSLSDAPSGSDLILIWFNSGNEQATAFPDVGVTFLGVGGPDGEFNSPGSFGYASQWMYVGTAEQFAGGASFEVDLPVTAVVLGYRTARQGSKWTADESNNVDEAQLLSSGVVGSSAAGGNAGSPYGLYLGLSVVADYAMAIQFVSSRTTPTPTTSTPTSDMTEIHAGANSWIGETLIAPPTGAPDLVAAQRLSFAAGDRAWWSYWLVLFDGPSYKRRRLRGFGMIRG